MIRCLLLNQKTALYREILVQCSFFYQFKSTYARNQKSYLNAFVDRGEVDFSKAQNNGITILPNFITSQLNRMDNLAHLRLVGHQNPVWYLTMNAIANQELSRTAKLFWECVPPKIDLL